MKEKNPRGSLVRIACSWRGMAYCHYGIDMGDGTVVHLASESGASEVGPLDLRTMEVRRVSIEDFCKGKMVHCERPSESLSEEETLHRASQAVGDRFYHLTERNCEHFARWCKTGKSESLQVAHLEDGARCAVRASAKLAAKVAGRVTAARTLLSVIAPKLVTTSKFHPAAWAGDVIDLTISTSARRFGYDDATARQAGWLAGCTTVGIVGFITGGPLGSSAMLGMHVATAKLADQLVDCVSTRVGATISNGRPISEANDLTTSR